MRRMEAVADKLRGGESAEEDCPAHAEFGRNAGSGARRSAAGFSRWSALMALPGRIGAGEGWIAQQSGLVMVAGEVQFCISPWQQEGRAAAFRQAKDGIAAQKTTIASSSSALFLPTCIVCAEPPSESAWADWRDSSVIQITGIKASRKDAVNSADERIPGSQKGGQPDPACAGGFLHRDRHNRDPCQASSPMYSLPS